MTSERVLQLTAEMIDLPESEITSATSRAKTETWDSLNHLQLITAIEREFGISLSMDEIAAIETVGDLQRIVASRGRSKTGEAS